MTDFPSRGDQVNRALISFCAVSGLTCFLLFRDRSRKGKDQGGYSERIICKEPPRASVNHMSEDRLDICECFSRSETTEDQKKRSHSQRNGR
ncbi:hypothetical protein HN011_008709 [Eciton burchellii]|nr:hypothetical protein HN011_008709 [Eciton burchellii]